MIHRFSSSDIAAARCVIFDFDGTLADTKPGIIRTARTVLTEWGIPAEVIDAKVEQLIGPPFPEAYSWVFGVSADDAEEITRRYRAIYLHLGREAWPLFDGVRELLEALHAAGRHVAVASSKMQPMVETSIRDNDVEDLFDLIRGKRPGSEDSKADAIRQAMRELGCTPTESVMVGDRHHDVEGAREAGIGCVGTLYGDTGSLDELRDAGAIAVVDTVAELGGLLLEG